jgi:hypothetical protein
MNTAPSVKFNFLNLPDFATSKVLGDYPHKKPETFKIKAPLGREGEFKYK